MSAVQHQALPLEGTVTAVWYNRIARDAIVLIHGGQPGLLPYCSGAHIWGFSATRLMESAAVIMLELPGTGTTGFSADGLTLDGWKNHIRTVLQQLGTENVHLVAHDTAALPALLLAHDHPHMIRAVTVVSSVAATPTGDGVEKFVLAYPPTPLWSASSQRWALEQVSYAHHHVDDELVAACVRSSEAPAHARAVAHMADPARRLQWVSSISRAKSRLFQVCRESGIPVPVQVVWGTHDPLGTVDQAVWSYRILAQRQPLAQFHLINRAGALPFREEVEAFCRVLLAFDDVTAHRMRG